MQLFRRCPRYRNRSRSASALGAEDAHGKDAGRGPARADIADLAVGEPDERHRLVRPPRRRPAESFDAIESLPRSRRRDKQHVELWIAAAESGPPGARCRYSAKPARELERALVGKNCLHEGDAAELAAVDRGADRPDAAISRALCRRDSDAVSRLEVRRSRALPRACCDGFSVVDVLARDRHFARQRADAARWERSGYASIARSDSMVARWAPPPRRIRAQRPGAFSSERL